MKNMFAVLLVVVLLGAIGFLGSTLYTNMNDTYAQPLQRAANIPDAGSDKQEGALAASPAPSAAASLGPSLAPSVSPASGTSTAAVKPSQTPAVGTAKTPSSGQAAKQGANEVTFSGQIFYTVLLDDERFEGLKSSHRIFKKGGSSVGFTWYYAHVPADITVKDSNGKIIGLFHSDEEGKFRFAVPKDNFYELELLYWSTKRTLKLKAGETEDLYVYYGIFSQSKSGFTSSGSFGGSDLLTVADK